MVITVISVATPIVSPSIVSEVRSLCARSALKHCTKLSRKASTGWKAFRLMFESGQMNLLSRSLEILSGAYEKGALRITQFVPISLSRRKIDATSSSQ